MWGHPRGLWPFLACLDLQIHGHAHFELLKGNPMHGVGMKVDLLRRLGLDEPIAAVLEDPDDPSSDARAGLLNYPPSLVAKLLELSLDGLKRGVRRIV